MARKEIKTDTRKAKKLDSLEDPSCSKQKTVTEKFPQTNEEISCPGCGEPYEELITEDWIQCTVSKLVA